MDTIRKENRSNGTINGLHLLPKPRNRTSSVNSAFKAKPWKLKKNLILFKIIYNGYFYFNSEHIIKVYRPTKNKLRPNVPPSKKCERSEGDNK